MIPLSQSHITFFTGTLKSFPLADASHQPDHLFLLCDTNTAKHCLPLLEEFWHAHFSRMIPFSIAPGEASKEMSTVMELVSFMLEKGGTRQSLLINLGGGVVSDLGGFAAHIFKRGIPYINIPTTLIGQIDAAIGGKTGINHKGIKNQIGTHYFPQQVIIDTAFLATLPAREFRSGLGELFKYRMIGAGITMAELENADPLDPMSLLPIIRRCTAFKQEVVAADPMEKGKRMILNFGHTIGHAIESALMKEALPVTHGEAVAAGIVAETFLSVRVFQTPESILDSVVAFYQKHFTPGLPVLQATRLIMEYIVHDKKNKGGSILPVLLDAKGNPAISSTIAPDRVMDALRFLAGVC